MAYIPRLTEPSYSDKRWINTGYGGYNECIVIDTSTGSVIPNCTGYVHGRWMEIGNTNTDYAETYGLSLGNASTYYSHSDNLQKGQEPALGAIIVFGGGGGAGHVAVVEQIISNDEIVCSESDYGGARFSVRHRYRAYGWRSYNGGTLSFQGFVYHPNISQGYEITIKNGTPESFTGEQGSTVTITANKPTKGMKFDHWNLTGDGKLENDRASTTVFTVGSEDATIEAVYRKIALSPDISLYYIAPFIKNNEII